MVSNTSFALTVKEEIAKKVLNSCCEKHFLTGFVKHNGEIRINGQETSLIISSISNAVIRQVYRSLRSVFPQINLELSIHQSQKLKYYKLFVIRIHHQVWGVLKQLDINNLAIDPNIYKYLATAKNCCQRAFAAGVFIAIGSVNSPITSNYHLELQFNYESSATEFWKFIKQFGFDFKTIVRKNKTVLYIKQSGMIADFINFIDANNSLLEFENTRISRDYKNNVNRLNNIDISNQQKTLHAGIEQINIIKALQGRNQFIQLSEKAQLVAQLRLTNPDARFNELAELMYKKYQIIITKSGINHLFREIKNLYNDN